MLRRLWTPVPALFLASSAMAAEDLAISGSSLVQIVAIVAPIIGSLALAWFNLRAGQRAQAVKIEAVERQATGIVSAASDLDKKVDGVKADVSAVHEATNGLSHRLSEASGEAGFGRGQEKERGDERLRVAEASAATHAVPLPVAIVGPLPVPVDARAAMLKRIEAMLAEYQLLPATGIPAIAAPPESGQRATLRDAVEMIQAKTDQLTFTKPDVVDAAEPPPKR